MSLRTRLALLFAIGTAAILFLSSALLYANFSSELNGAINAGLSTRADDIVAALRAGNTAVPEDEQFAQVVTEEGRVVTASATLLGRPALIDGDELDAAAHGEITVSRAVGGLSQDARLLARPSRVGNTTVIVVVGSRLDALHRARRRLAVLLLVASPALIAALAIGGLGVATAALRPVRQMTADADRFSLDDPGQRVAVPGSDDEIAHLAHTLNAMLERVEQSFQRQRAFVDDASHELRTPVAILRGELELALADPSNHDEVVAALRSSLEEAERLSRVAEDLLVLARVDTGMLAIQRERVDLLDVAAHARERAARQASSAEISVEGSSIAVAGDHVWLEQMLGNLLRNAVRVADRIVINVAADDHNDGSATITVADDGPGFPPELLPVVFDRFARSHRREGEAGAGLGLAIVAAYAAAHGGSVTATNGPPLGGAVVRVTLPRL